MREVDYDKNKIDYLYLMTEKCIELDQHVMLILERLMALEKIHNESPNLALAYQTVKDSQPKINQKLEDESKEINDIKVSMINFAKEIQELVKSVKA